MTNTTEQIDPRHLSKWDHRFLTLALLVSTWSKDPSTKCGAVIVRSDKTIASLGFNGFPKDVEDRPEDYADRAKKLALIVHAEANAIGHAKERLEGHTVYVWPMPPCDRCAAKLVEQKIGRVITIKPSPSQEQRWGQMFAKSREEFGKHNIELIEARPTMIMRAAALLTTVLSHAHHVHDEHADT